MRPNYFIIHGSFGSPFVNWLPWLRRELRRRGKEVYTPDFPTGVGFQNYDNWNKLLKVYLDAGLITEDTTIFAHSIAPVFISKFLIEHQVHVKKLVFVCGFNNYTGIDEEYDSAVLNDCNLWEIDAGKSIIALGVFLLSSGTCYYLAAKHDIDAMCS